MSATLLQMIAASKLPVLGHSRAGREIRGGRLAEVVRNPNYRGISATFWRSLAMVWRSGALLTWMSPWWAWTIWRAM